MSKPRCPGPLKDCISAIEDCHCAFLAGRTTPHQLGFCDSTRCSQCAADELDTCDVCPEYVNPDARCTHGRELCPEHLTGCPECRADFHDDGGLTR